MFIFCSAMLVVITAFAQKNTVKELDWLTEDGSCRGKNCLNGQQHQWLDTEVDKNKTDKTQLNKSQSPYKEHDKTHRSGVVLKMD